MLVEIESDNSLHQEYLTQLVNTLGISSNSFRYFNTRPKSVIINHLCTVILFENNKPIGYGHLDQDFGPIWLGIAVVEGYTGKGNGQKIMNHLFTVINEKQLTEVNLSVDSNNSGAIKLYERYGFIKTEEKQEVSYFKWLKNEGL
jgi:GNAT superfamily N-acetyltransferase